MWPGGSRASLHTTPCLPLGWTVTWLLPSDLEREMLALNREESKLVIDIKAAAKQGNQPTVRVLAKSLIRLRGQKVKLQATMGQLRGVRSSITVSGILLSSCATCRNSQGVDRAAMCSWCSLCRPRQQCNKAWRKQQRQCRQLELRQIQPR